MKQQESLVNSNLSAERLRNRIRNNEANQQYGKGYSVSQLNS
jgi:hypothetical protein